MRNRLRWRVAQSFEIRWWKNYLKNKDVDEYLTWKRGYWTDLLARLKQVPALERDAIVLDAGCGPAGIFTIFPNNKVHAVDPLLQQYDALPHFDRQKYSNVQFHAQPMEDMAIDEKVDLAFCLNVINHVDDIRQSMQRLAESIKPGGLMVLSIDAHNYGWLKRIFQAIPGDILHPHQYDLQEYKDMVEQTGSSILEVEQMNREMIFSYYVIVAKMLG